MQASLTDSDRRRFLTRMIWAIQSAIGGTIAFVLGGSIVPPGVKRQDNWLEAATLSALRRDEPTPVMLRVVSYLQTLRTGRTVSGADPELETAARVFAGSCVFCHQIDGEGGTIGPDLTHVGRTRDARWLREWISDPGKSADGRDVAVSMPAFSERLSDVEIDAISSYLARRK